MMLGQLLRSLPEASDDEIASGFTGALVRLARIQPAAAAREQSPGTYLQDAIRRFSDTASPEEWTPALGRLPDDPIPGTRHTDTALQSRTTRCSAPPEEKDTNDI